MAIQTVQKREPLSATKHWVLTKTDGFTKSHCVSLMQNVDLCGTQ